MSVHKPGLFGWLKKPKFKQSKDKRNSNTPSESTLVSVRGEPEAGSCPNPEAVPPSKAYAFEATKQTLDILSSIVGLVGIPLVKEVIDIGLAIIKTCEGINEVQERVEELKNRVAGFLVIIAKVTKDSENDPVTETSKKLLEDLQEFKQSLILIKDRLQAIANQNVVLITLLPAANKNTIEECVAAFQDGIDRFQTLRGIHAAQDLDKIQLQLTDLYQLTTTISHNVDKLRVLLEKTQMEADAAATSVELPPLPDIFVGRDEVVDRIAAKLATCQVEVSRVCVLGPGGIGKSSVALAVLEHPSIKTKFPPKNRIWIPCISLRSPSALLAHLARRVGTSTQADPLASTVSALEEDGPYLIHFDNFETPWRPIEGEQAGTKRIIQSLDKLSTVSILVTMRSEFQPLPHWGAEHLEVLSLQDCQRIYSSIEPEAEGSQELDTLLGSVGYLPYAVMLLAKYAASSASTPSEVLEQWQSQGSQLLSDVEGSSRGMEASIELSVQSPYVSDCTGAMDLLQVISLLPAGVIRDDLSIWTRSDSWNRAALGVLRHAALVMSRKVDSPGSAKKLHLYVLPVVQSYFRQRSRIPPEIWVSTYDACFQFLCRHKIVVEGPNAKGFRSSHDAIASQEGNIQALLTEVLQAVHPRNSDVTTTLLPTDVSRKLFASLEANVDAFLTFVSYQRWSKPRLDFVEHVAAFVSDNASGSLHDANATQCLAAINESLDKVVEAGGLFEKARDLFLRHGRHIEACVCDFAALTSLRESSQDPNFSLPSAIADAGMRWKDYLSNPVINVLVSYLTADLCFLEIPNGISSKDILDRLVMAKPALIFQQRPFDGQDCLKTIIRIQLWQGLLTDARASIEEALDLIEVHGLPNYGSFHYYLSRCLKASGNWGPELMAAITHSLTLARKVERPYHSALALEELAEIYVREGDWPAARLMYEEVSRECRKGSGYSVNLMAKRARNNLIYIAAKTDSAIEHTDFMPPYPY